MNDSESAWAKINLYLHVTGRRSDGYHLLDSLVVFADIHDTLEGQLSSTLTFDVAGPFAGGLETDGRNLVLRAVDALRSATGLANGASLRLWKALPVAAGIGGGSADAAAALRLLNRMWGAGLSVAELCEIGETLGADVPACILSKPLRMSGAGEILAPLGPCPDLHLVLVNPGVHVATAGVFAGWKESVQGFSAPGVTPRLLSAADFISDLAGCRNDLEAAAIDEHPVIGEVLSVLCRQPGCQLARMSGSGATCLGLFDTADAARRARKTIAEATDWWVWNGGLAQKAQAGSAIL